jgi:CDP-4-dehydro-6-deoxyglucose reductase
MAWKWYDAQVADIADLTPNTKSFWLRIDGQDPLDFRAGQFITLDLPIHEKRHKRWRSYSIANLPGENGLIELCIVRMAEGAGTNYLFNDLQVGDKVRFKGPDGNFIISPEMLDKEIIMLCTGTGVAPFRSMLLDLQHQGTFRRPIHLIFGTRTEQDILYREEFEKLAREQPRFQYTVALSRDRHWDGVKGHLHQVYLNAYQNVRQDRLFLICGWSKMIDEAVENLIIRLGYDKTQVRYELYG